MSSLREGASAGETRSRRVFGQSLVVAQVALSVIVLSAAGLFVRHLSSLRNSVGFDRDSVLLVSLDPARSGYEPIQLSHSYRRLLERLEAIPGVRSAAVSGVTPIQGPGASRFVNAEGFHEDPDARRYVSVNWVGPKYFATFGTPLVAGRDFEPGDEVGERVAIVNRALARYYFGDRSPLGLHVTFEGQTTPHEVVGVVGDAKYYDVREPAPRTIYLNAFQDAPGRSHQFSIRTAVAPMQAGDEVRRAVREVLKTVPVAKVTTLADQVDASIVLERLIAMLSGLFGALGLALAALGVYGLLAYSVARRVNEIGIRMAFGATERDVTRMVMRGALGMIGAGLAVGAALAAWSGRIAMKMVENLSPDTAVATIVAASIMIAVGLLAAYLPARRAARVNPMDALRHP